MSAFQKLPNFDAAKIKWFTVGYYKLLDMGMLKQAKNLLQVFVAGLIT